MPESKARWEAPWSLQRAGIAAAVALLGLGGWALHRRAAPGAWPAPLPPAFERFEVSEAAGLQEPEERAASGHESLEEVLKALEEGAAAEAAAAAAGGRRPAALAGRPGGKKVSKPEKARRPVAAVPEKQREVVAATSEAALEALDESADTRKADTAAEAAEAAEAAVVGPEAEAALEALDESADTRKAKAIVSDFVQRMLGADSGTARKVVEKARKKSRKPAAGRQAGPSEEDKEKAKAIIRDTIQKLDTSDEDPESGSALSARLRALLGEDDGAEGDSKEGGKAAERGEGAEKDDTEETHLEFVKLLRTESERKAEHSLSTVKEEFKREFAGGAKPLLCSGCKLVAARLDSELSTHDVHEQDSPAQMLAAKRRAIDATCTSFRHLHVVKHEQGLRFEAGEDQPEGPGQPGAAQRLCTAILEEARFELLTKLIQRKVPETSHFHSRDSSNNNWERWLCAQRTRVCKRTQVKEDDEDQEL